MRFSLTTISQNSQRESNFDFKASKLTDAVDRGLHIVLGCQIHGDHRCTVDFTGATSCRVLAGYLGCLVEQMRHTELFVVANEALKSHRRLIVTEQLHDRMSETVLILDRAATSLSQIPCSMR